MSKSTIATVGLFFGISRWNGYFWARMMIRNPNEWPLQVYIRNYLENNIWNSDADTIFNNPYAETSIVYAMVVCAIIPILIIYPYIQKYFAKGVNLGGVKE
jgi:putative aldouronate transport system permease protein